MQMFTIVVLALVASVASAEEVLNVQPVVGQQQPQIHSVVEQVQPQHVQHHAQGVHQPQFAHHQHQYQYAPAGLVQVVGGAPQQYSPVGQAYPSSYYAPSHYSASGPAFYAASGLPIASPVQVGSQVYGAPVGYEQPLSYADAYSTKRIGGAAAKGQERVTQQQQVVEQTPAKGYQAYQGYRYVYAAAVPAVQYQYQHQPQVQHHQQVHHYSMGPQVATYSAPVESQ